MANHTAKQLSPAIGTTVTVRFESLQIQCLVMDAKNAYGNVRLLIVPVAGQGEQWVDITRLIAQKEGLCTRS